MRKITVGLIDSVAIHGQVDDDFTYRPKEVLEFSSAEGDYTCIVTPERIKYVLLGNPSLEALQLQVALMKASM